MLAKLIIGLTNGIGQTACRIRAAGTRLPHAMVMPALATIFCVLLSYPAHPAVARSYPMLFGSYELQSSNMKKFPKWNSMLARWKNGAPCESATCTTKGWKELIARLQGKDLATQ